MIEASLPQQSVETKKITRKRLLTVVTMSRWSLPLILAFQALLSWALLQNTAFQDEALYIYAGGQIWQHWFQSVFDQATHNDEVAHLCTLRVLSFQLLACLQTGAPGAWNPNDEEPDKRAFVPLRHVETNRCAECQLHHVVRPG